MHLKYLDLQGFKSFLDKTRIKLEPGISCIVGPNGSGKSNIADAVRWVLGEQSARSLRGAKMEDILFSGGKNKKPIGFAEVTMTLDNSDGALSTEYTEVTVTRRSYRDGEGEYLINGNRCRLKDVQALFADAGISAGGVSIVSQGRVDQIVEMKPVERRMLVEEMAGIIKYRNRKNSAMRKLAETEQNLMRLSDLLGEISGRVEPLHRQAEAAARYQNLSSEAEGVEINLVLHTLKDLATKLKEISEACQQYKEELRQQEAVKSSSYASVASLQNELTITEEALTAIREKLYELSTNRERQEARLQVAITQGAADKQNLERLQKEIDQLHGIDGGFIDKVAGLQEDLAVLEAEVEKEGAFLAELSAEATCATQTIAEKKQELAWHREEAFERAAEFIDLRNQLAGLNQDEERKTKHITLLTAEKETQQQQIEGLNQKKEEQKNYLTEMDCARKSAEKRLGQLDVSLKNAESKSQKLAEEEVACRYSLNSLQSRLHILEDMQSSFEGYYPGVKAILQGKKQQEKSLSGIYGAVADLIETSVEYQTAVEAALASSLQFLVAEDSEAAHKAIDFLKQNHAGRATFLPVSDIRYRSSGHVEKLLNVSGVIGRLSDVIKSDKALAPVVNFLGGQILLVEDLDTAVLLAKQTGQELRAVTLDGDMITPGGAISGGSKGRRGANLLSRRAELNKLAKEVTELTAKASLIKNELKAAQDEQEKILQEKAELQKVRREAEMEKISREKDYSYLDTALLEHNNQQQLLAQDIKDEEQELAEIRAQISRLQSIVEDWEKTNSATTQNLQDMEKELEELSVAQQKLQDDIAERRVSVARKEESRVALNADIERLKTEKEDLFSQEAAKKKEIGEFRTLLKTHEQEEVAAREELTSLADTIWHAEQEQKEINGRLLDKQAQIREQEQVLRASEKQIAAYQEELHQLEIKEARRQAEWENEEKKLTERFNLTYEEALPRFDDTLSRRELQKRLQELTGAIKELGPVNIAAIAEYAEVKERYDFLSAQQKDMLEAKASLDQVICEMDKIMSRRFSDAFQNLGNNFNITFNRLFGGGSAGLVLSEPDNILETGVEIVVSLPGKQVKNYNLLSGGEKSLIGIALLLAVLRVRPSSFCVLDEVDAALDEANVDRFAAYLQSFSHRTQFLLITHRQGTMEVASSLWGVTMEEAGISKMISVRLEDVEQAV